MLFYRKLIYLDYLIQHDNFWQIYLKTLAKDGIVLYNVPILKKVSDRRFTMVGVIVCGHGSLPQEFVRAAEMICGIQKNVRAVSFQMWEDPSLVRQRYEEAIEELDCSDGVLFLCDLFGGTPFNEASRLIAADEDYGIVTGLNLPLLIDLLTSRRKLNGSMAMRDLLAEVKRLAHEGVASLHMDDLDAEDLASGVAS